VPATRAYKRLKPEPDKKRATAAKQARRVATSQISA
jgi:hypothetical protein